MTPSLAERLKTETRALHAAAERSALMGLLLRGRMSRGLYCALLRNLHALYAALEPALVRHALHPMIAPVFLPALWRTRSLELDLLALHGADWAGDFALQPAAHYVRRLKEIEARPERLLAHAYVRFLGDLSGGQALRRIVAQTWGVPGRSVTAFYEFGDAAQTGASAQAFRDGLGRVAPDAQAANAIVAEARLAFQLHQRLFDELAGYPSTAGATAVNEISNGQSPSPE